MVIVGWRKQTGIKWSTSKMNASSRPDSYPEYDIAIPGGGPAGGAAAITLARACRSVVVIEKSQYG